MPVFISSFIHEMQQRMSAELTDKMMSQSEIKSSCHVKGLSGGIWFETLWWEGGGGGGAVFGNKKKQEEVGFSNILITRLLLTTIATNNHAIYLSYWWLF